MTDMKEKAIAICDETEPEVEALKSVLVVLFANDTEPAQCRFCFLSVYCCLDLIFEKARCQIVFDMDCCWLKTAGSR